MTRRGERGQSGELGLGLDRAGVQQFLEMVRRARSQAMPGCGRVGS